MTEYELVLQDCKDDILRFDLTEGSFILGRGSGVDIRIQEPSVSRQHAMISNEGGVILIRDLGSRNGTYVNGEPVMKKELTAEDLVTLGTQSLRLLKKADQALEESENVTPMLSSQVYAVPPQKLISQLEAADLFSIDDLLGGKNDPKVEAIKEQYEAIRSLYTISNILASDADIAVKLQAALDDVVQQVGGECGYVLLVDEKTKRLVPLYSCSLVPGKATISRSLAETVVKKQISILTDDAMADSRFSSSESVSNLRIHSALAVPIWTDESLLGVLYVSHHHKVAWFDKRHLSYASSVGKQMGMAIKRDAGLRRNQSLVKYLSNIRKVLEHKIHENEAHAKQDLARQRQIVHRLLNSESIPNWGVFARAIARQIDKPIAVLMPRLRFIAKYSESLEQICENYQAAAQRGDDNSGRATKSDFHELVRKIRETLLVCQAEIKEIQQTVAHLGLFDTEGHSAGQKVDLNESVERLLKLLTAEFQQNSIEVVRDLAQASMKVNCSPIDFELALFAMILNGVESLLQKPLTGGFKRAIRVATQRDGDYAVLTVSDNGVGISGDARNEVFEVFHTTKENTNGVGLGLARAKSLAQKEGGHIACDTVEGYNASIRITLPMSVMEDGSDTRTFTRSALNSGAKPRRE
ncbi:MAG: FHA domain-containing protein [Candidatus Coatesbacteria bacterium]|nr:FHA domain-containing protein [Candidatus Coatesbacteria bacterium]